MVIYKFFLFIFYYFNIAKSAVVGNPAPMPIGYWTSQKNKNMRTLLETFAKKSGFDFLVPSNWYKCKGEHFAKLKVN
jgi:hypothetical protein